MIRRCVRAVGVGLILGGVLLPLRAPGSALDLVALFVIGGLGAAAFDLFSQMDGATDDEG